MEPLNQRPLQPTPEEDLRFEITMLKTRVRELEHIVHGLIRDRVNQEEADAWHEVAGGQTNTFTPNAAAIEDRGHRIADQLNRWPDAQKWRPRG